MLVRQTISRLEVDFFAAIYQQPASTAVDSKRVARSSRPRVFCEGTAIYRRTCEDRCLTARDALSSVNNKL